MRPGSICCWPSSCYARLRAYGEPLNPTRTAHFALEREAATGQAFRVIINLLLYTVIALSVYRVERDLAPTLRDEIEDAQNDDPPGGRPSHRRSPHGRGHTRTPKERHTPAAAHRDRDACGRVGSELALS